MHDRGEKIVNLAREMLRAEQISQLPEPAPAISLKVLCLATLLAAFGSSAVTAWGGENHHPINHYEKIELDALIFYAARLKGLSVNAMRHKTENCVGANDIGNFTERDYRIARDYLRGQID